MAGYAAYLQRPWASALSRAARRLTAVVTALAHLAASLPPGLADALDDRGAEGQAFGLAILPEVGSLADQPSPDSLRLFPGAPGAVTIDLGELFPAHAGAPPPDLAALFGDDGSLRAAGAATAVGLDGATTAHGQAWSTVTATRGRAGVDLRDDPLFIATDEVTASLDTLVGEFTACRPVSAFTPRDLVTRTTSEARCLRAARPSGTLRLTHELDIGVETETRTVALPARLVDFEVDFRAGLVRARHWVTVPATCGRDDDPCPYDEIQTRTTAVAPLDWDALCGPGARASVAVMQQVFASSGDGHRLAGVETPSCANGLVFRATTFGDPCFTTWRHSRDDDWLEVTCEPASLRLLLSLTTLERDRWGPPDVLDGILALQAAGCRPALTLVAGSDGAACIETGGGEVCPGDAVHRLVAPPPFDPGETAIHRLALQVEADVAACTPVVPVAESCEPLRTSPACSFRTTFPVEGAGEPGAPMLFEDVYDCETDRHVETVTATAGLACPPPVRGLGDDLVTPLTETNDSFAEAAAQLSAARFMAMDTECGDPTDPAADPLACSVFTGERRTCSVAIFGIVDCCESPGGVSIAQYLSLAFAIGEVDGALGNLGVDTPIRGAWEFVSSPFTDAWGYASRQFASGVNSITGTTVFNPTDVAARGLVTVVKQNLLNATAEWTASVFGDAAANALFQSAAGPAVEGGMLLGDVALGPGLGVAASVLGYVMLAYTIYNVAMLLASIVWSCSAQDLETAVKRELRACRSMGTYCSRSVFGICLQRRRSFCCFASPLSRIMQEQIRLQTGRSWGSARNPDCGGMSVAELSGVDFAALDLSEWLGILMDAGALPDGAELTAELLTGSGHAFAGALPAGHSRADAETRALGRTDPLDIEAIGRDARRDILGEMGP
jgi:conjugal transfer mating pair stabilization protein TraN